MVQLPYWIGERNKSRRIPNIKWLGNWITLAFNDACQGVSSWYDLWHCRQRNAWKEWWDFTHIISVLTKDNSISRDLKSCIWYGKMRVDILSWNTTAIILALIKDTSEQHHIKIHCLPIQFHSIELIILWSDYD